MDITEDTRYHPQDPTRAGCATCYDQPTFQCERCRRQFCATHLRLASWKVARVAPYSHRGEETMMRPIMDDANARIKLVCVECAQTLMNWGQ